MKELLSSAWLKSILTHFIKRYDKIISKVRKCYKNDFGESEEVKETLKYILTKNCFLFYQKNYKIYKRNKNILWKYLFYSEKTIKKSSKVKNNFKFLIDFLNENKYHKYKK